MIAIARAGLFAGLLALAASPAAAQAPEEADEGPATTGDEDVVVARVGEAEIMLSEVIGQIYSRPQAELEKRSFEEMYQETLQRRIDRELVYQAAVDSGLADDPRYLERIRVIERRVLSDTYMQRELARRVDEDDVRDRYSEMAETESERTELWARHLRAEDEAAANALKARLDAGEDFVELAHGLDYPGASVGGDLGYFTEDNMAPEIVAVARGLELGEVSAPVETPYGWLLIKLEDSRPVAPPSYGEARQEIFEELSRDAFAAVLDELRAETPVERFGRDGAPLETPAPPAD